MRRSIFLAAAIAVILASCTAASPPGSGSGPPSGSSETPGASEAGGTATVTVVSQRECCYTEGAYYFARLETADRHVVLRKRFGPSLSQPSFQTHIPPGEYVLVAYSRPCSASCPAPENIGDLDEATDVCREEFQVSAGDSMRVRVLTTPGGPCRVRRSLVLL